MSADELRRAADGLRGEWSGGAEPMGTAWHRERDFHLAVADWLKSVAADLDKRDDPKRAGGRYEALRIPDEHAALAVARAYVGGPR